MEEKVFELSFMQETLEESGPVLSTVQSDLQLLEDRTKRQQEANEKSSEQIENNEDIQEEILEDDFELSKTKVKDNLSDVCKKITENFVKCQVKADVTVQVLKKKLQTDIEKRCSLEKYLDEYKLQAKHLQAQVRVEQKSRTQSENEMLTLEQILSINSERIQCQEIDLCKYKTKLLEYESGAKEIRNELKLMKELQEEIRLKQLLAEEICARIEFKKNKILENHKQFIDQKTHLERSLGDLQEINKAKQELLQLKDELNSVDLDQAENMFVKLKEESKAKIYDKNKEYETLNQRLLLREDYLKELNNKLNECINKNSELIDRNILLTDKDTQNRTVHEELVKKLNENRLKHQENLDLLRNNKEELEVNVQKIESNIAVTIENVNKCKERAYTLQEQLSEKSSTINSLSAIEKVLEEELETLVDTYQGHKVRLSSIKEETLLVEGEIERLNAEKICLEEELRTLRTSASTEVSELNKKLEFIKSTEKDIEMEEIQFETCKLKGLQEIQKLKESNEAKLNEIRDNLEKLNNTRVALQATIEDLNTKLRAKTERRDALHNQYKQLQSDIDNLEHDVKIMKENYKKNIGSTSELGSFQKPAGILKTSSIKSPQKKVTFDKNLDWDSLSESSTDVFFDNLLTRKATNQAIKKRKITATSDDIFNILRRNSPPERDVNNI